MAVFAYKGLDVKGNSAKGLIDAENLKAANLKLKQQNIIPTTVEETLVQSGSGKSKISLLKKLQDNRKVDSNSLAIATRQLATLVGAGMPLLESLRALAEQIDHLALKKVISEVSEEVNEGSTFAAALRKYPKAFPRLYANMVASGESSGTLELVLNRLAELLEAQTALKRKVSSALFYPIFMIGLCFLVVVILLVFVVPKITQIFASKKVALPFLTRVIIALSDFTKDYYLFIFAFLALSFFWFSKFKSSEKGRKKIDKLILKIPFVGGLVIKIITSRFAKNLSTMLASGIELLPALATVKNVVDNTVFEQTIEIAIERVREGGSLAVELERSKIFPKLLVRMISVGEKTGQLEQMLSRAATNYENEVSAIVSGLTSLLEPILIIFLAVIVGVILAAVMLPMLEMASLTGI